MSTTHSGTVAPTAGPLHIKVADNGDVAILTAADDIVAECFTDIRYLGEWARDEARANATLYAAAPLMLEALQRAADTMRDTAMYFRVLGKIEGAEAYATAEADARAAIAAATGAQ